MIGIVVAIFMATFVLIVILRKIFSDTSKKSRYQRTYSVDVGKLNQQQDAMTDHSLPQWSSNNHIEEIRAPSPTITITGGSSLLPNSQLIDIDLNENENISTTQTNENNIKPIDYNELVKRSSLLRYYAKDFDDDTGEENNNERAETESEISSAYGLPKQLDKIVTWEECM
ncbi:hypothetical protein GLOIN_2v1590090, partial [Rhizophagus irregularis DAOM 181602=DAOM 197198]